MSQEQVSKLAEPLFTTTATSRLYAFELKLRPLQRGSLMAFSGELVHGAFLHWLKTATPEVASWLHDGNKRRVFTCSSLQWSLPPERLREAERKNIHLPLDPHSSYTVRITLLIGELFPLFHKALMGSTTKDHSIATPPFMQIGKQLFLLEEVHIINEEATGWTGFITFDTLVEHVKAVPLRKTTTLTIEFDSLTTFNRSSKLKHGTHYALLPMPLYIFPTLAMRWKDVAPPALADLIQAEALEQYTKDDGVIITDYNLRPHQVHFTTHIQPGFIGTCTYQIRHLEQDTEVALPLSQQILLLAQLGFYCGAGYKTSMGMGRMRPVSHTLYSSC
jgi:CRISPR/Cas system endoribonuclease Cas6 (RAMP superfamily)